MDFEKIAKSMDQVNQTPQSSPDNQIQPEVPSSPVIEGSNSLGDTTSASGGLISVTDMFRESWQIYTGNIKRLLAIAALPILAQLVLGSVFGIIFAVFIAKNMPGNAEMLSSNPMYMFNMLFSDEGSIVRTVLLISIILSTILMIFVGIITQASLVFSVVDPELSIRESLSRAKAKFWPILWASLLSGLVVMGGLLLLVIPGIVLSIMFALVTFVVLVEDKKGFSALSTSSRYIKPFFFGFLGRTFVFFIAVFMLMLPVGIVAGLLDVAFFGSAASVPGQEVSIVSDFVNAVVNWLLAPFMLSGLFVLYRSIKQNSDQELISTEISSGQKAKYSLLAVLGVIMLALMVTASIFSVRYAMKAMTDAGLGRMDGFMQQGPGAGPLIGSDTFDYDPDEMYSFPSFDGSDPLDPLDTFPGGVDSPRSLEVPSYGDAQMLDMQRMMLIASLAQVLEVYRASEGTYPADLQSLVPEYIESLPVDPATGDGVEYTVLEGGSDYEICGTTEALGRQCAKFSDFGN